MPTPRWHQPRRRCQDFVPARLNSRQTRPCIDVRKESRRKNSGVIHGNTVSAAELGAARRPPRPPHRRTPPARRGPRARPARPPSCPAGEVTIARSAAGSPRSARSADEPTNSCVVSVRRPAAGAGRRPRRRRSRASATRNRYAGPEPVSAVTASRWLLADPLDDADGAEDALGPGQVVVGRRRAAGDGRRALADEGRRVGHRPDDGDAPVARRRASMAAIDTPAAIDRMRVAPAATASATAAGTSGGLTAMTAPAHGRDGGGDLDVREQVGELAAPRRQRLGDGDRQRLARPPPAAPRRAPRPCSRPRRSPGRPWRHRATGTRIRSHVPISRIRPRVGDPHGECPGRCASGMSEDRCRRPGHRPAAVRRSGWRSRCAGGPGTSARPWRRACR